MGGLFSRAGSALSKADAARSARSAWEGSATAANAGDTSTAAQSWQATHAAAEPLDPSFWAFSAAARMGQSSGMSSMPIGSMDMDAVAGAWAAIRTDMPSAAHIRMGSKAIITMRIKARTR